MKYRVLFFACLSAAALAGCGQKGPLYLPVKAPPTPSAEAAPAAATEAPAEAASAATTTDTAQDKDKKKDATSKPAAPAAQP